VGYSGGTTKNPSYHNQGDHTETVQIDYDPARISYKELLDIFWKSHSSTSGSWLRQYRAVVFYHNEEQRKLAENMRDQLASVRGRRIMTAIEPYSGFYIAEDYHQKHDLQLFPELMREFKAIYPDMKSYIGSTAVTRVNGYLGGYGKCDTLQKEVEGFGLSPEAREKLISVVCGHKVSLTCPVP
jgi:peptide-methionine (S)-S-oxide reductase